MAHLDVRLASGKCVEVDASIVNTVGEVRRQISETLKVPESCLKLVSNTGAEPSDGDPINLISTGVTSLVIVIDKLQEFHEDCVAKA